MQQLIWSLIAGLLLYGCWQFLSALRAGTQHADELHPFGAPRKMKGLDEDLFSYAPLMENPPGNRAVPNPEVIVREDGGEAERDVSQGNTLDSFAIELEFQRLRRELDNLKEICASQRQEINTLRLELLERLPGRPGSSLLREPGTSPEYDEALALARRGVVADVIATRCGITRAEADLVTSLATRAYGREMEGRPS
ncbi:MAG: DUF2802 domain-containing protein [Azoarcus sp.]|jgi:hypothetical protein|nr:DUF2802 domain-containing protein [Azoarcus sp.]